MKYLTKPISLLLAVLFICFSLTACTGETDNSFSNTEESEISDSNAIDNAKKDEELITEDEKYGRVIEGMLGAAGTQVREYSGYLGYGYNVLTSAFYNHKDIKTGHPVVDMDALAKVGNVYIDSKTSSFVDHVTYISTSAKEYSEHFSAAANVKAKYSFVGSFEASFKMSHTTQMSSNQKLITTQALLETQNDYILDVDAKLLADYATNAFKRAVAEKTAEELIELYGTHVLANISMGGRYDLNYLYTRTETSSSTDIEASAKASYRYVSGGASGTDETDKTEIETHSKLYAKSYGGTVTGDRTTIQAAKESYKEWAAGVEDGKIAFVNASEVIPLWEVVAKLTGVENAAEKSAAIKKCFDDRVDEISGEFKETINAPIYISDIYIGYGTTEAEAKNMLRNKGVTEGHIVNLDLNKSVGGYWIYLGYKTTADESKAITGLVADYYDNATSSDITYNGYKYTIDPVDLNKGAKGKYIYLYYTRDPKAGDPITAIQYQRNGTFQFEQIKADGFTGVISKSDGKVLDLNKGAGGDYIYLWFRRS